MSRAKLVHAWLLLDPETLRVAVMTREPGDGDFPRGLRGLDWPVREADIPAAALTKIARASIPGDKVNELHRKWWSDAAPEGVGPWPA